MHDALWCAVEECHVGTHAERTAISNKISREDQDAFALRSHQNAIAAIDGGRFDAELAPVTVRDAKGRETIVAVDEGPRRDSTIEALARLKPAFDLPEGEDRGDATSGTATAGNVPGITDGAAATVVVSERTVERYGLKPLARIIGYAQADIEPKWLFLAPVMGVRRLLDRIEMPIEAFDLIEINEAFAAQVLADGRELGFDWDKVNVNGGAIALGHPVGASGARIVATLLHELRRREGPLRSRDPVPRRRRVGGDGVRAGLTRFDESSGPGLQVALLRHARRPAGRRAVARRARRRDRRPARAGGRGRRRAGGGRPSGRRRRAVRAGRGRPAGRRPSRPRPPGSA